MTAVMLSIKPKWCDLIASGKKSIEVRKARPKLATPFRCYIYESLGKVKIKSMDVPTEQGGGTIDFYSHEGIGKIIGEFVCDKIEIYDDDTIHCFSDEDYAKWNDFDLDRSCIHPEDFERYASDKWLYGWHISELKIYDKPKELSEFRRPCVNDLACESCAMYSESGNTCGNEALLLTRPPQSWCYVSEMI